MSSRTTAGENSVSGGVEIKREMREDEIKIEEHGVNLGVSSNLDVKCNKESTKINFETERKPEWKHLECPHCDYKTELKSHQMMHLKRNHPGALPLKCGLCSYRHFDSVDLEKHRKLHKVPEAVFCNICRNYATTDLIYLKSHKRQEHWRKCPDCNYGSLRLDRLMLHTLAHKSKTPPVGNPDSKRFNCPHCAYRTDHMTNYKSHLYRHTGERPYSCDQCDYKTARKGYLKSHVLLRHTKEKMYKCETCEYKCATRAYLQKHEILHMKNQLFTCEFCQKTFAYKSNLQIHLRTHAHKEKKFFCDECDFSTAYKVNLKSHKKSKHSASSSPPDPTPSKRRITQTDPKQ